MRPTAVSVIVAQGVLLQTGQELDVAIDGPGYIEVTLPSGTAAYTRDGALQRTGDGLIVTNDGFEVAPGITIPSDVRALTINANGEIWAYFQDQVAPQQIGTLALTNFTNEKGLEAMGSDLYLETQASGPPLTGAAGVDGLGVLRQGYLEESSVDAVKEVTELIKAQRGYELNAKVITAVDQMLAATTQVR